nr:hypothetical protein [Cytophagales bacterium]
MRNINHQIWIFENLTGFYKNAGLLILYIMVLAAISCNEKEQCGSRFSANESYELLINDSVAVDVTWFENGLVQSITTKDKFGIKNGLSVDYYPNGMLKNRYSWKDNKITGGYWIYDDTGQPTVYFTYAEGEKNGDMYEFLNDSTIKAHFLFKDGRAIYVGYYDNGKKTISSAIPAFKDEVIKDDSIYNVRISFPFPFKGDLEIFLKDTIDFNLEYLDKHNVDLTITNFDKTWAAYEFLLEYVPAEEDSLSRTEQIYTRTLDID